MLHNDKTLFALLLLRVYLTTCTNEPSYDEQFEHLLRRGEMLTADAAKMGAAASTSIAGLGDKEVRALLALAELKAQGFGGCVAAASAAGSRIERFAVEDKPEADVPVLWADDAELSECSDACSVYEHGVLFLQRPSAARSTSCSLFTRCGQTASAPPCTG